MKEKIKNLLNRIKRIAVLTFKKAMDPYFSGNSAEVAFFLLMSIVPSIILLAQVFDLFDQSMDLIKGLVKEYANDALTGIIMPLLNHESAGTLSILLVILALWSGSKAIFSLMRITNYAYIGGTPGKNPLLGFIKERARAMLTVFVIIFTLIFAIGILIFGKYIVEAVLTYLNDYIGRNYNVNDIWLNIRWVLGFLLYFFMVTSIYYVLPSSQNKYSQLINKENKWVSVKRVVGAWYMNARNTFKIIFPGSIFASLGMMVATWVYSLYLSHISSANFNILYGSLGAAVLLLLWFYILAYVLVLGIQINSIWEDSKGNEELPNKYKEGEDTDERDHTKIE